MAVEDGGTPVGIHPAGSEASDVANQVTKSSLSGRSRSRERYFGSFPLISEDSALRAITTKAAEAQEKRKKENTRKIG